MQLWLDNSLRDLARQAFVRAVVALDPELRVPMLEAAAEFFAAGQPVPPFTGVMAEAEHWADWASPAERKAYTLAGFTRLSPKDRLGFLNHIGTEVRQ